MSSQRHRILVTGGSRGIGAATVLRLARDGHDVVLTYRERSDAAEAVASHAQTLGSQVDIVQADLRDPQRTRDVIPQILSTNDHLTGLVNNAGVTGRIGPFLESRESESREVFELSTFAPLILCQAFIAHASTGNGGSGGSIVNVSSGAATTGAPGSYIPYAMAKAALDALTKGLAAEFGPFGIRVNSVQPGTTETDIHADGGRPNAVAERSPGIPLRRAATTEEVAGSIAYFFSPDAGYTSGAILRVTGGR